MNNNQNTSPVYMQIDNYASGENSSNIINNYLPALPSPSSSQNSEPIPNLPNQILEALTTIKKYLSRQEKGHEIKVSKETVTINGQTIFVNYEACKICKNQHGSLTCPGCQRKVCAGCVTKRGKIQQCLRCKGSEKTKNKLDPEFDEKIEKLLNLENEDRVQQVILVEIENLGGKSLEELIEVVKKLELKRDKLDRAISLAYFFVGKVFYERMEEFFSEDNLTGEQKNRRILSSFRLAKDLDFGGEKMTVREIKEKLGVDDNKISRFFSLTLKVYLTYKNSDSAEEEIRKAERIPATGWLRDLSQEKFLNFLEKLIQRRNGW